MQEGEQYECEQKIVKISSSDILTVGGVPEEQIGVYIGKRNVIYFTLPDIDALTCVYGTGAKSIFSGKGRWLLSSGYGEDIYRFTRGRFCTNSFDKNVFAYVISEAENGTAYVEYILRVFEHVAPTLVYSDWEGQAIDRVIEMQDLEEDLARINEFLCMNFDRQDFHESNLRRMEHFSCGCVIGFVSRNDVRLLVHIGNVDILVRDIDTLCRFADESNYVKLVDNNCEHDRFCIDVKDGGLSIRVYVDDKSRRALMKSARDAALLCRSKQKELSTFSVINVAALANLKTFLEMPTVREGVAEGNCRQINGGSVYQELGGDGISQGFAEWFAGKATDAAVAKVFEAGIEGVISVARSFAEKAEAIPPIS
ncbi:MAG: hypothetical protein KAX55_00450 [Propionivibrio sp.]|nr:hypothetical protein [Propionivibrio sp.]